MSSCLHMSPYVHCMYSNLGYGRDYVYGTTIFNVVRSAIIINSIKFKSNSSLVSIVYGLIHFSVITVITSAPQGNRINVYKKIEN